jgi:hypothetical protein
MAGRRSRCALLCLTALLLTTHYTEAEAGATCSLLLQRSNYSTSLTAQLNCNSSGSNRAPTFGVNSSLISTALAGQFQGVQVVDITACTDRWTAHVGRPVQAVLAFCGQDDVVLDQLRIQGKHTLAVLQLLAGAVARHGLSF